MNTTNNDKIEKRQKNDYFDKAYGRRENTDKRNWRQAMATEARGHKLTDTSEEFTQTQKKQLQRIGEKKKYIQLIIV